MTSGICGTVCYFLLVLVRFSCGRSGDEQEGLRGLKHGDIRKAPFR